MGRLKGPTINGGKAAPPYRQRDDSLAGDQFDFFQLDVGGFKGLSVWRRRGETGFKLVQDFLHDSLLVALVSLLEEVVPVTGRCGSHLFD
jgi:hypothetical protein